MSGKGPEKENREKNVPGQELGSTECLSLEQPRRNAMTREAGLGGGVMGFLPDRGRCCILFCAPLGAMECSGNGND